MLSLFLVVEVFRFIRFFDNKDFQLNYKLLKKRKDCFFLSTYFLFSFSYSDNYF